MPSDTTAFEEYRASRHTADGRHRHVVYPHGRKRILQRPTGTPRARDSGSHKHSRRPPSLPPRQATAGSPTSMRSVPASARLSVGQARTRCTYHELWERNLPAPLHHRRLLRFESQSWSSLSRCVQKI